MRFKGLPERDTRVLDQFECHGNSLFGYSNSEDIFERNAAPEFILFANTITNCDSDFN